MRLLLIRHGETPGNVRGQLDTAFPGPGLTVQGEQQARELIERLNGTPLELIAVSTLQRTRLTATPLADARRLSIKEFPGLHEIQAGDLELHSDPDSISRYLTTIYDWGQGNLESRIPGGTNGIEFFERFDRDLETVAKSGVSSAAVFSHGAAIRVWVSARARNIPFNFGAQHHLPNCGIVELSFLPNQGWSLVNWNGLPVPQTPDSEA